MCTKSDLQLFIRSGGYAWPGGYQCALMMSDGECIDAQSARENYRQIRRHMVDDTGFWQDQWKPEGVFIHWEGDSLICAHSGREIPSACGPIESEVS